MALKQTFEFNGVEVPNGYLKVTDFAGSKLSIGFSLAYKASAEHDAIKIERFNFVPTMDKNFIQQAYEHLKELPQFENASNC
ncbi:MAG: hypothetical protein EBR82_50960 [Caulobacteraceae bacterium]|nr:hypothetical protein [Caulobacteraceae bacterium]